MVFTNKFTESVKLSNLNAILKCISFYWDKSRIYKTLVDFIILVIQ